MYKLLKLYVCLSDLPLHTPYTQAFSPYTKLTTKVSTQLFQMKFGMKFNHHATDSLVEYCFGCDFSQIM